MFVLSTEFMCLQNSFRKETLGNGNLLQTEFIQECAVQAWSSQFIHIDYEVNTIWRYQFIFNINAPVFQKESFNNE